MRLDKLLCSVGMTRSEARRAIASGRVRLRGETARDAGVQAEASEVLLDFRPIDAPGEVYLMLNKPAGVITAARDACAETVLSLLPESIRRKNPSPVGRLDKDVTGLLLFTTDGELLHRLISPRWEIEKVYLAEVEGTPDENDERILSKGVHLSDFVAKPAKLEPVCDGLALLTVTEGKFHQVKRMFAAIGHPVVALQRLKVGGVELDHALQPGEFRPLTDREISTLYTAVKLERK